MTALHTLSAAAAAGAFAARQISPAELMETLLARIAALEPRLHAFIRLDADLAMAAARNATDKIAAGRARGPLHGVPIVLKDLIDVAGQPTTCHSRLRLDHVATTDATVVARLRQAGAILLGKTALHEFAIGGPDFDLPFPPARNPWNTDHHPGGSSSGSAVAVAVGFAPLALGTDTGGSIRHPASACGIVGLKPTYGLLSRRGVFPLAFSLDHVGPLTRTVADAALLLDALAGHDPQDPGSAAPARFSASRDLERGARGLRIGFVRHFHEVDLGVPAETAAALETVARGLAAEGAEVRDITLPPLARFGAASRVLLAAEAWAIHAPWLRTRPEAYGRLARQRLVQGAFLDAGDVLAAQRERLPLMAAVEAAFAEVDVLLTVSSAEPPARFDDGEELARTYSRSGRSPFNLTGHPALAMPTGIAASGLPLSVQMVGRCFEEATLLRAARAWERLAGTDRLHPPIAA